MLEGRHKHERHPYTHATQGGERYEQEMMNWNSEKVVVSCTRDIQEEGVMQLILEA